MTGRAGMRSAAERKADIDALRAEGLTLPTIAHRLGLSHSYVSKVAAPNAYTNSLRMSREAKQRRVGTCVDCGALTRYEGRIVNGPAQRCRKCSATKTGLAKRGAGPYAQAVLACLDGQPRHLIDIHRDAGASTVPQTWICLRRLLEYGMVEKVGRGVYQKVAR